MTNNLKPLRPTLREKKRYVVFKIVSDATIEFNSAQKEINSQILLFLGILYAGKAGILIMKNQYLSNYGIIRVNHLFVDELKAALMHVTKIDKQDITIDVIGVSGILKKAREKFLPKEIGKKISIKRRSSKAASPQKQKVSDEIEKVKKE